MNIKRMRSRNNRPNGSGNGNFRSFQNSAPLNRNHVFDSNGPEQRVRGTAQQLYDKYQQMARDASSSGDRVLAESYFQYAEHYFRITLAMNQAQGGHAAPQSQPHASQNGGQHNNGNSQNYRAREASDEIEAELNNTIGAEIRAPGYGEQPTIEAREIPISPVPPEN
jgi:hypothetical protein